MDSLIFKAKELKANDLEINDIIEIGVNINHIGIQNLCENEVKINIYINNEENPHAIILIPGLKNWELGLQTEEALGINFSKIKLETLLDTTRVIVYYSYYREEE